MAQLPACVGRRRRLVANKPGYCQEDQALGGKPGMSFKTTKENMKTKSITSFINLAACTAALLLAGTFDSAALPPPWGTYFGVRIDSPANGAVITTSCGTGTACINILADARTENTNGAP